MSSQFFLVSSAHVDLGAFWAASAEEAIAAMMADASSDDEPSDDIIARPCIGRVAIWAARAPGSEGLVLRKHADPIDGARIITIEEAEEICAEDPSLVYLAPRTHAIVTIGSRSHVSGVTNEPVGHRPPEDGQLESIVFPLPAGWASMSEDDRLESALAWSRAH